MSEPQTFFCHKLPAHTGGTWYAHLFKHKRAVEMCGDEPIIKITVTEDPNGPYFG
jgi:hypothetical protein